MKSDNPDGTLLYKSACRMCHGGCGVIVHVEDGKVVKVQGDRSRLSTGQDVPQGIGEH